MNSAQCKLILYSAAPIAMGSYKHSAIFSTNYSHFAADQYEHSQ